MGTVVAVVVDGILVLVPDSCQDAGGYVFNEPIRQALGITGDKRSKKNVLAARFRADTTSSGRYVINENGFSFNTNGDRKAFYLYQMLKLRDGFRNQPGSFPENPVIEIANEPNAFPYLPPHLYAWYYSMWYNYLKDIEAHQTEIAQNTGLTASSFYKASDPVKVDVMPGGLFIWYGYPQAVLDLAKIFGVRENDDLKWYREFIGALGSYGRPEEMISRSNFHFYPFTFGQSGKPFDKHFEHLNKITEFSSQHSRSHEVWLTEMGNILNPMTPDATSHWMEQFLSGLEQSNTSGAIKRWFWFIAAGRDPKLDALDGSAKIYSGIYKDPYLLKVMEGLFPNLEPVSTITTRACNSGNLKDWTTCASGKLIEGVAATGNIVVSIPANLLVDLAKFIESLFREFITWDSLNEIMAAWAINPGLQNLTDSDQPSPVDPNDRGKIYGHFADKNYFFREVTSTNFRLTNADFTSNSVGSGGTLVQFNPQAKGIAEWNESLPHEGLWRVWVRVRDDLGNNHANDHFFENKYQISVSKDGGFTIQTSGLKFVESTKFAPYSNGFGAANLEWAYADFSSGFLPIQENYKFELSSQSEGTLDYTFITNDFGTIPSVDGPYNGFNHAPPLPKSAGTQIYAENFGEKKELNQIKFVTTQGD